MRPHENNIFIFDEPRLTLISLKELSGFIPRCFSPSLIHHLVGTKFPAHGTGAMFFINPRFGPESAGFPGIESELELTFPVELLATFCHGEIFLHRSGDTFDDIAGVGGDAAGHDPFVDILNRWQTQVFAGGNVAEEVSSGRSGDAQDEIRLPAQELAESRVWSIGHNNSGRVRQFGRKL